MYLKSGLQAKGLPLSEESAECHSYDLPGTVGKIGKSSAYSLGHPYTVSCTVGKFEEKSADLPEGPGGGQPPPAQPPRPPPPRSAS